MALKKDIIRDNGINTSYHRIMYIQSMVNKHISIVILSYINGESRQTETNQVQPYSVSTTYTVDYQENMTIEEAYAYLKSLPEFEGAEDI